MFTPWNETCPIKCRSPGMPVIQLWQNPCNPSYSIPLGPAPWNFSSACLVARSGRTGEDSLDLLNRGHVIPLGLYAPYALCYSLCPLRHALYVMHHACHSTREP